MIVFSYLEETKTFIAQKRFNIYMMNQSCDQSLNRTKRTLEYRQILCLNEFVEIEEFRQNNCLSERNEEEIQH